MNKSNSPESVVGQRFAKAKREWHDLSHTHLASYAVGFHTPMKVLPLTGNSTVVLNMEHALQTNPTATPVFDSMRVNVRVFFYPQRLCTRGLYGNNYMGINRIEDIELPVVDLNLVNFRFASGPTGSGGFYYIAPGSLLERLGLPCGAWYSKFTGASATNKFISSDYRKWDPRLSVETFDSYSKPLVSDNKLNVSPIIGYYEIFNHFLANPYDPEVPMHHFNGMPYTPTSFNEQFSITYYNLYDAIDWVKGIKGFVDTNSGGSIPSVQSLFAGSFYGPNITGVDSAPSCMNGPYGPLVSVLAGGYSGDELFNDVLGLISATSKKCNQQGLCPSTYMEDGVTTYFDNEEIEDLMTTEIGNDVESIRFGKSIWNRLFRSILDGRKYKDWEYIHFGNKLKMSDHPIFCGADFFNLRFNDVFNASASNERIPLGASASRGDKGRTDRKEIVFTAQEPGYMFVICDIVPYVSYAGRVPNWADYKTMASFPLPEFSGYTFQDLKGSDVVFTSCNTNDYVIGKQPLYYDYMSSVDTLSGIFAGSLLDTYTFKRTFNFMRDLDGVGIDYGPEMGVSSTYIQKYMYDYAFPDWGQNGGENIFIKTQFDLRVLQPIARQVAKTRI